MKKKQTNSEVSMAKTREKSIDKDLLDLGAEYHDDGIIDKKPNWINLAQLDSPTDDSLANRLLYKVMGFCYIS